MAPPMTLIRVVDARRSYTDPVTAGPEQLELALRAAAVDLEASQTTNWDPQLSLRGGIQLVGGRHDGSDSYVLQLSLDYYHGRNLNGQFYYQDNVVDYWGVGLHAYF